MKGVNKFLLGVVAILAVVIVAVGAYYIGQNQQETTAPLATPTETIAPTDTPTPTTESTSIPEEPTDDQEVIENIQSAVQSKNYAALEGYTTDTVSVRLEASSCCGLITQAEAISQLSYLDPATNWDFDPTNPILVSLAAAAPTYYGNDWTVGVASNEYVFSFKLNSENKMDAYNISATYKLLTP